jgi:hypothetical protein
MSHALQRVGSVPLFGPGPRRRLWTSQLLALVWLCCLFRRSVLQICENLCVDTRNFRQVTAGHRFVCLGFSCNFSCHLEDRFGGKDEPILDGPPPLDDPLFIDQEERPPCHQPVWVPGVGANPQQAIAPDDFEVGKVTKQRVGQLEGIRKRLLREGVVGADPENLDIQLLELLVIDLPGRQIRRSRRAEIVHVEFEEDVLLPPELAEADCSPCGAGECEV